MKPLLKVARSLFLDHGVRPRNVGRVVAAMTKQQQQQQQHQHPCQPQEVSDVGQEGVLHGQGDGCRQGCTCICEVQLATEDRSQDGDKTVTDAKFVAKQFMLGADNKPLRTSKGRLMLEPCSCKVLTSVASISTTYAKGRTLDTLRNSMLFTPHAPDPFLRTVVRNMGLSTSHSACLQVAEKALVRALTDRVHLHHRPVEFAEDHIWMKTRGTSRGGSVGPADERHWPESEVDFRQQYEEEDEEEEGGYEVYATR